MPLKKLAFRPGINRERSRYANEGGWYDCDKIRFRQGLPEKIGGWQRFSESDYLGICRSIFSWVTLDNTVLWGVGTHLKFYIYKGGVGYDVTPLRSTTSLGSDPISTTNTSAEVSIADTGHGANVGDYVTLSGLTGPVGGIPATELNAEHVVTDVTDADNYKITVTTTATSSTTGGGASGQAEYQVPVGPELNQPFRGWGAGVWGSGTWGVGGSSTEALRVWHQGNFGEDLIFGYRGGPLLFWDSDSYDVAVDRGTYLEDESGASDVPTVHNRLLISDSRFVFVFGANAIGSSSLDPMLIRWSDQEDAINWTPSTVNQAGSIRLLRGNEIVTAVQVRQEILVWTDTTLYSLQFVGAPEVWGQQIAGDNLTIVSPNAVAFVDDAVYWMGRGKFYMYRGAVKTMDCDVLRYVLNDFDDTQQLQVFAGANEQFNEVWWFYPSSGSDVVDKYVVYNYEQEIWYYGTLGRTAWLDAAYPMAATYDNTLVQHEVGIDDESDATATAIEAYIESSEFDIADGDQQMLIRAVYPDVVFDGSTVSDPNVTLSLLARKESGSAYNDPQSEGGNSTGITTRTSVSPVEVFTERLPMRVRGRNIVFRIESDSVGVQWQLGAPRIEVRPSGRR